MPCLKTLLDVGHILACGCGFQKSQSCVLQEKVYKECPFTGKTSRDAQGLLSMFSWVLWGDLTEVLRIRHPPLESWHGPADVSRCRGLSGVFVLHCYEWRGWHFHSCNAFLAVSAKALKWIQQRWIVPGCSSQQVEGVWSSFIVTPASQRPNSCVDQ